MITWTPTPRRGKDNGLGRSCQLDGGVPLSFTLDSFGPLARTVGWIAQWKEMIEAPKRIGRPRQRYIGDVVRPYVPLEQR